ncbi:MAG TPA: helix-turn-helix transcriptional regulator [Candidatus Mediterraneibacter tabaqchaliae]|uniref:Helix-turn-helix transcriptional regulator n=1 Tax=Candidatus Mediterraneibacter tabaqchaliae TaxID=2838689 RepID=A0A9D2U210_9FIRM|nr:helix-turn-helix transcriptional regulator [Candidatus Mediterraneibacter tabaqchaliae]
MEESSRSIADREEEAIRRAVIAQYIEYRKRKGITQQDIADSMGIKRPNISRFESGNYNPSLDMLIRMADKMDLQIEITLREKGDK